MSSVIERFLICDGCGENYGVDCRSDSIREHRRAAKSEGWIYKVRSGEDFCPKCVEDETGIPFQKS